MALICAIGALTFSQTKAVPASSTDQSRVREATMIMRKTAVYRRATWHWESVMGVPRTRPARKQPRTLALAYRRWVLELWQHRAARAWRRAISPPHKTDWLCIHRYEAGWHANTGNGYYGGLQMDISFQRRYGWNLLRRKGTADRWTPLEQMWVAEHAHRSGRGFYPWPNTARYCGLI